MNRLKAFVSIVSFLVIATTAESNATAIPDENARIDLKVERVIDGDTIVADGRKIRLWGINAPEKNEDYYQAAKLFLESLLKDGKVSCKLIDIDKYQREVMHCFSQGDDLGSLIVQVGLAEDFEKYSAGYYAYEQDMAKKRLLGIWKGR